MPTRYELVPDSSQVWIEGSSSLHPIHATATGLNGWVELSLTKAGLRKGSGVTGEVRVDVSRLESGNSLVDRETRRRIDANRFPEIVGTAVAAERVAPDRVRVEGDLEFRGESCRVSGDLSVSRVDPETGESSPGASGLLLEGTQSFDVRDWGLNPPKLGLVKVHPDIEVRVRLTGRVLPG
jgi:hypothetical protein